MLSQRARYGLRALVALARNDGGQLSAGEISRRADAPRKFLETILLELSHSQIVVSRRGKYGGYTLAREASAITFAEIIRAMDGPLALAPCVSPAMGYQKCADCPDFNTCGLREALHRARNATADVLEAYTLAEAAAHDGEDATCRPGSLT